MIHRTGVALVLSALLVTGACARHAAPPPVVGAATTIDPTPRLAIMSAIDAEWIRLREATTITGTRVVQGRTHYLGR
ncbi:MAG: hypothetical protein MUE41_19135, partial [Gemmatimonadaceae bacterium]|nr:hypothetical protein [Gemmatimonadaceae bacterium]